MASYRSPSPSSSAGSPAPAGDYSADGIPPLAFETEAEILDVLRQLRGGLQDELRSEWNRLRGAEDQGAMAEETVLKDFFDALTPVLLSNSTIGGQTYSEYKKVEANHTLPFNEILHERVLKYQDATFDARAANGRARRELPLRVVENLRGALAADREGLAHAESINDGLRESLSSGSGMSERKKQAKAGSGPSVEDAEKAFTSGMESVKRLTVDAPHLVERADRARMIAEDAGSLD